MERDLLPPCERHSPENVHQGSSLSKFKVAVEWRSGKLALLLARPSVQRTDFHIACGPLNERLPNERLLVGVSPTTGVRPWSHNRWLHGFCDCTTKWSGAWQVSVPGGAGVSSVGVCFFLLLSRVALPPFTLVSPQEEQTGCSRAWKASDVTLWRHAVVRTTALGITDSHSRVHTHGGEAMVAPEPELEQVSQAIIGVIDQGTGYASG